MAKTGLLDKLVRDLELGWKTHQLLTQSKEAKAHNESLKAMLQTLKDVRKSQDIVLALGTEQTLLHQELKNYANSPEESGSIQAALDQLTEAKSSLGVVDDHQAYQKATATYPSKNKEAGLPLDSFRMFLKSHATRLGNRMASPLSVPEKNLLRQRKENLSMIKEVYMAMQRKALGLDAPAKGKDLEL